jgi:hypothetical protein
MYGKLFVQMYDGTLATAGPWQALVTFQQLLILANRHGEVDMTAEALSRRTTIPLDVLTLGLAALEQPDPGSRSPAEDGRRIVRLAAHREWGWRIVNYLAYAKIRNEDERREYQRQWAAKKAATLRPVSTPLDSSRPNLTDSTHVDVDTDTDVVNRLVTPKGGVTTDPDFERAWSGYPKRPGNAKKAALKAWTARRKEGVDPGVMLAGVDAYAGYCRRVKPDPNFIKLAATFFGPDRHFEADWTLRQATPTPSSGPPLETTAQRHAREAAALARA